MSPPRTQGGGGEQHMLAGEGVEGPNSDDWTESLALCRLARNSGAMYTIIPLRFEINVDANTSWLRNVLKLFMQTITNNMWGGV